MNIGAMAVVTLVVFAEKVLPLCRLTSRATAVALIAYGAAVIAVPQILTHS
jgi:predicted metal-binding membrane protein